MMVTLEDVRRLNLRIGRVVAVQDHPNASRLYLLTVDLGTEQRQVVAGLKGHYTSEELQGKWVVVVCDLEPKDLRGVVSQGMVLAASPGGPGSPVAVLTVDPAKAPSCTPGSPVS